MSPSREVIKKIDIDKAYKTIKKVERQQFLNRIKSQQQISSISNVRVVKPITIQLNLINLGKNKTQFAVSIKVRPFYQPWFVNYSPNFHSKKYISLYDQVRQLRDSRLSASQYMLSRIKHNKSSEGNQIIQIFIYKAYLYRTKTVSVLQKYQ